MGEVLNFQAALAKKLEKEATVYYVGAKPFFAWERDLTELELDALFKNGKGN